MFTWSVILAAVAGLLYGIPEAGPAKALDELQGPWEVVGADASAGVKFILPPETGLTRKGAEVTIRGNKLLSGGKVVANLTIDFSDTGLELMKQVRFSRQPMMLTLSDGKGILLAYTIKSGSIEMVHPHTMGRIGAGSRVYLRRPAKK